MKKIIKLTENDLRKIVKNILNENFDESKLYDRDLIIHQLKKGPSDLKEYIKKLPKIPCLDKLGNEKVCTRINEHIFVYLTGQNK